MRKAAAVAASTVVLLASCGGSPRTVSVPAPQGTVAPGYDSPQAAVAGYLAGHRSNDAKKACAYVAPPQTGFCNFLAGGPKESLSAWRLGNAAVRGNEAIVVVMSDAWCFNKLCFHNNDPNNGLPKHARGFETAFDKTSNSLPAVSVVRVNGKWYVALA
jgi:hypothetical protein